jgi:hypothetical protein
MHHPALAKLTANSNYREPMLTGVPCDERVFEYASDGNDLPMNEVISDFKYPREKRSAWCAAFLKAFGAHRYEHQLELTPHIYGPHRPPPISYYEATRDLAANPFAQKLTEKPVLHSSMLTTSDAMKVFDAISFAMWRHGKVLNAHVIIVWSMIPGIDEATAAKKLGLYLNEATKWAAVEGGPRSPSRQGDELHYTWVHENAPGRGFHTHVLMNLPHGCRKEFDDWSRSCLARLCKASFHEKAFRVVLSRSRSETDRVRRVWGWYRYLMKQLHPGAGLGVFGNGGYSEIPMRDIVKPWPAREALPITLSRRTGVSHSLGRKKQDGRGFVSKMRRGTIDEIYDGREFGDRLGASLFKDMKCPPWHPEFQ